MTSFLKKVINDINLEKSDLKSICFVLPNKRSSYELKKYLSESTTKPVLLQRLTLLIH
jgi:hypothetical protein